MGIITCPFTVISASVTKVCQKKTCRLFVSCWQKECKAMIESGLHDEADLLIKEMKEIMES